MREVNFRFTSKVLEFSGTSASLFEKLVQKVIRPYGYKFFSDQGSEAALRSQIKNARKNVRPSALFFALLAARDNTELATLRTFAEGCARDQVDRDLKDIVFIVFDEVLTEALYEQFIEYQANYACASKHGFLDQQKVHNDHAQEMVKEWMGRIGRGNATVYLGGNARDPQPISMKHLPSTVNDAIAPTIFPFGPDACELLRRKTPSTFWRQQNSKEMVRTLMFATSKDELTSVSAQMRPIQYLLQECLDDDLGWKADVPEKHPFKVVFDKVQSIIKHADKSLPFNLDEKFSLLCQPPYGLYGSFAPMAMIAFALRPWAGKVFDMQGKPRDENALIDDIVLLFKVWDDRKSNAKLSLKFQTPEEGKLCKDFVSLFGLKGAGYPEVSSLKDARFAITSAFLERKGYPLWALKYASTVAFAGLPATMTVTDDERRLIDNIVTICAERDLRNPALVKDTLALISALRFEMRDLLKVDAAFADGFKHYLTDLDYVNIKDSEVEDVKRFLSQNLQSTVGYWTEEEVKNGATLWRAKQVADGNSSTLPIDPQPGPNPQPGPQPPVTPSPIVADKRKKAEQRIARLRSLDEAKGLLATLVRWGNEWVLDKINE